MKKFFSIFVLMLAAVALIACQSGPVLNLYLPNEYINEDLLDAFRKETGIRVSVANFDDNEQALASLQRASYDLVIPSDYAIEELSAKDLLLEIDWSKIDGFNKETDYEDELNALLNVLKTDEDVYEGFDLLKYAVPYFWGSLGIVYDTRKAGLEDLINEQGWNVLINANNDDVKRVLYASSRDAVFVALKANNISLLKASVAQINTDAANFLNQTKHVNTLVLSDSILYDMIDEDNTKYDLSVAYSGDAVYLMDENPSLDFIVPHQGTNVFIDGFVIPKNSKNVDAAYQFISFMYEFQNARDNSVEVGYSSPIKRVYQAIKDDEYAGNEAYIVHYNASKDEFFRYDDSKKIAINDIWNRFAAGR